MGKRLEVGTREALVSEIRDRLTRTSSPRLTILIVLTFAGGAAFLTSFAGLAAGIDSMAVRYALASIAGYLAFVVLIRCWIAIRRGWQPEGDIDLLDPTAAVDVADLFGRGAGRGADAVKSFAGGRSGGGGGGSSWISEPVERAASVSVRESSPSSAAGEALESVGGSLDLDDGAIVVFIVIAVLAALGGIVCIGYVIYIAPMLLAEVALDAALVSAVYRRLRKEDVGHWTGAVFRRTWIPAAILVIFMFVAGYAAQRLAPEARSIGGVIRALTAAEAAEAAEPLVPEARGAQESGAEQLIGLLNLPDMIPQPCGPETPVNLDIYGAPSAAKPPIGALAYEVSGRTPGGVACNDVRIVLRRAPGGVAEDVPVEESDYEVQAAIVYQQSGPWYRIALKRGSAWIRRDDAKNFLRYPELLLQDRLPHMAAGWDGRLWRTPGAPSARPVSPAMTSLLKASADTNSDVDVDVLAIRRIRGEAWIQVRVVDGHCGDEDPVTVETGWVPAYRATGERSVWFYSRGC